MGIARTMALAVALFSATATSQLPEFSQQYRQRLGGAIDALERIKLSFYEDANAFGMTVQAALAQMRENGDAFVVARAQSMEQAFDRLESLKAQQAAMQEAGSLQRILVLVRSHDPELSSSAWSDFEPAIPVTQEALIIGGFGFLIGYSLFYGGVGLGKAGRKRLKRRKVKQAA
ncbi:MULTISPECIES: DUF2937 family protein [Pseudovibrio]|uniref:DUF2937 family protein n=1 Tax=Stappiaceae TaxID=2821832 RepID=UPI002366B4E4|nr:MULTISPECIES: DUF2937 family protein [Pseudovibrio]MDD7911811.1 DUF2937 family protein [Pseudovibrio exalbescens]MDX5594740.1 DUF2937 family protein [Pseudovibrio sp. SPO723]